MDGKRREKEKRDKERKVVSKSLFVPVADVCNWRRMVKKRVKKEKRDKEMTVAVDRLWNITSPRAQARYTERRGRKYSQRRAENTNQGGSRASGMYTRGGKRKARGFKDKRQSGRAATAALSRTWSISSFL